MDFICTSTNIILVQLIMYKYMCVVNFDTLVLVLVCFTETLHCYAITSSYWFCIYLV